MKRIRLFKMPEREYFKRVLMRSELLTIKPKRYRLRFKGKFRLLKNLKTLRRFIKKRLYIQN
jgi:hypothetical protein